MGISSKQKWREIHARKEWRYVFEPESVKRQEAFFLKFLKGERSEIDTYPKVRMEVRDRAWLGEFRSEQEWPLARTKYVKKYLEATSGKLIDILPTELTVTRYDSEAKDDCVLFCREFTDAQRFRILHQL
ncbi:hypothetical protein B0J14DRAFT_675154 [Halenospora varia]|nr:hypothetical protein B0J14DRAFT_675154 [Halenospora varia]